MRRLVALANGLGPTSRSAWGTTGGWGDSEHLLATIADRLEDVRFALYESSVVPFKTVPEQRYIQRPHQPQRRVTRGMSATEFFAMMQEGDAGG